MEFLIMETNKENVEKESVHLSSIAGYPSPVQPAETFIAIYESIT